jgi:hypothetical protein
VANHPDIGMRVRLGVLRADAHRLRRRRTTSRASVRPVTAIVIVIVMVLAAFAVALVLLLRWGWNRTDRDPDTGVWELGRYAPFGEQAPPSPPFKNPDPP